MLQSKLCARPRRVGSYTDYGIALRKRTTLLQVNTDTASQCLTNPATSTSLLSCSLFRNDGAGQSDEYLLSASVDGTIKLWDPFGRLLQTIAAHDGDISHMDISPDREAFASTALDGTVKVWHLPSCYLLRELVGHSDGVTESNFSHDGFKLVTASWDYTARVWDVTPGASTQACLHILRGHTDEVTTAKFSAKDELLATTSWDGTTRLWRVEDGTCIMSLNHAGPVRSAVFVPGGHHIVSHGQGVKLWSVDNGSLQQSIDGHDQNVNCVLLSTDGAQIVTASEDRTALLWGTHDAQIALVAFIGHTAALIAAQYWEEDGLLVTMSRDGSVRTWDTTTGRCLHSEERSEDVTASTVSHGRRLMAWATADGHISIATSQGRVIREIYAHERCITAVGFV